MIVLGRRRSGWIFVVAKGVFPVAAEKICKDIRHAAKPIVGGVGLGVCLSGNTTLRVILMLGTVGPSENPNDLTTGFVSEIWRGTTPGATATDFAMESG